MVYPELGAFTLTLHYVHPEMKDYEVYDIDAGTPDDPNIVMMCSKFDNLSMIGEPYTFMISKIWIIENLAKILKTVPDN
jgi:hypothetical protein